MDTLKQFVEKVTNDLNKMFAETNDLQKQYERQMKHAHKSKQEADVEKARGTFNRKVQLHDRALEINNAMRVLNEAGYFQGLEE